MAALVQGWFYRLEADRTASTRLATEEAHWSRAPKGTIWLMRGMEAECG
jgi:hypothetical protein